MEADLARYKCAMNMVDGALDRSDVKVFEHTKTYRVLHTANKSWGSKLPVSSGTSSFFRFQKNFARKLMLVSGEQFKSYMLVFSFTFFIF